MLEASMCTAAGYEWLIKHLKEQLGLRGCRGCRAASGNWRPIGIAATTHGVRQLQKQLVVRLRGFASWAGKHGRFEGLQSHDIRSDVVGSTGAFRTSFLPLPHPSSHEATRAKYSRPGLISATVF